MTVSSFKFAVGSLLTIGALAAATSASALTLPTQGLKANATLTFSPEAYANAGAATVVFAPLGNTIKLPDVTVGSTAVEVYQFPVTKADVSIGWDLKITPNSGVSSGSALLLSSDAGGAILANFAVNFKTKQLLADIIDPYTKTQTKSQIVLYTFIESQPSKISFKNLVLNQTSQISELTFSAEATDELAYLLGLPDVTKLSLSKLKWGTIDVQVTSYARKPAVSTKPFTAADAPDMN